MITSTTNSSTSTSPSYTPLMDSTDEVNLFQDFHPVNNTSTKLSTSTEISSVPEVEFLDCPKYIHKHLKEYHELWIHGSQGSSKHAVIQEYLSDYKEKDLKYFEINAGAQLVDLSISWMQAVKKIRKGWNMHLPPSYLETIVKEEKCLFIIEGVKIQHLSFLRSLMKEMHNQDWIILTHSPLHEKSLHILFDRTTAECWIEKAGIDELGKLALLEGFSEEDDFSADPILLPIAIEVYKEYSHEFLSAWSLTRRQEGSTSFIPFLIDLIRKKGENLNFQELLLLKNNRIKTDFFEDGTSLKNLMKYKLIQLLDQDSFILPRKIRNELQKIDPRQNLNNSNLTYLLVKKFQGYVGLKFNEANKWTIPHITFIFDFYQKDCPQELLFPLTALLWSIGYFYTQDNGEGQVGPQAAKQISIEARNAIENFINKKHGIVEESKSLFHTKTPAELVALMNEVHPLLAHLYANIQFQIGRCYFYNKDPREIVGSKVVLNFAKKLAEHIEEGKSLLFKTIDRNGLLFHLNEEKKYEKAICGYESLLIGNEVIDIIYHNESKKVIQLQEDLLFQITCTEFILHNLTEWKDSKEEKIALSISHLEQLCAKLNGEKNTPPRPALILIKGYLRIKGIKEARNLIEKLKSQNLTILDQLQTITCEILCELLDSKSENASQKAIEYRKLAETYYKKGFYALYNFLPYEDVSYCQEQINRQDFNLHPLSFYFPCTRAKWSYQETDCRLEIENIPKQAQKNPQKFHFKVVSLKPDVVKKLEKNQNEASQNRLLHREEKSYPLEGKISHTLSNGPNTLVLGDGMYKLLSHRNEIGQLMTAIKNQKTFKESIFSHKHGYRFKLENSIPGQGAKLATSERESIDRFVDAMGQNKGDWTQFAECYISQKKKLVSLLDKKQKCTITTKELCMTAWKIQELPLFQEATCFTDLTGILNNCKESQVRYFLIKNVHQFHFPALSTFAYHVLKHVQEGLEQREAPILFGLDGSTFNLDEFQSVAKAYLHNARELVKKANWSTTLPDQLDDNAVDYAFYSWKDKPEELMKIFNLQEEFGTVKKMLKSLKNERKNIEYTGGEYEKNLEWIDKSIKSHEESLSILRERLDNELRSTVSKVMTYMTTLRVIRGVNTTIFFKTYFLEEKFDLTRAREGQLKI